MGCFDVTCRLTNTAISAYEECIMIIIDADSNTSFYELMRLVHRQSKRESQEYSKHEIQLIEENPALWKVKDRVGFADIRVGEKNIDGME